MVGYAFVSCCIGGGVSQLFDLDTLSMSSGFLGGLFGPVSWVGCEVVFSMLAV